MPSHRKEDAPYADIRTIGIPRALMYHRYAPAWTAFSKRSAAMSS